MLRATIDALKNKNNKNNPSSTQQQQQQQLHQNHVPEKRPIIVSDLDSDEEDINALLDEIERINPLPSSHFTLPSSSAFGVTARPIVGVTPNQSLADNITVIAEKVVFDDEMVQFLPEPFVLESFKFEEWHRNVKEILKNPMARWEERVLISNMKGFDVGSKIPLALVMIKEIPLQARDYGVVLVDESGGEIGATLQESIFTRNKIRPHFGMTLLLKDFVLFSSANDIGESGHIIVTFENIIQIFCNVHLV